MLRLARPDENMHGFPIATGWKRILLLALASALLFWLVRDRFRNSMAVTETKLPQSIEQYRIALTQPDFGMYFLDYSQTLRPHTNFSYQMPKVGWCWKGCESVDFVNG